MKLNLIKNTSLLKFIFRNGTYVYGKILKDQYEDYWIMVTYYQDIPGEINSDKKDSFKQKSSGYINLNDVSRIEILDLANIKIDD